jgi:tetratricopeptide (TPR) repeat protein
VLTPGLWSTLLRNHIFSIVLPIEIAGNESMSSPGQFEILSDDCRVYWHQGIFEKEVDPERSINFFQKALECDPRYIPLVESLFPDNAELAQQAVQIFPDVAEGWFWLGGLIPEAQIEYYRIGLSLDPDDGHHWLELGQLLRESDPETSMQAFLEGCFHGDPGYNSCLGAGNVAKDLGEYELAIQYYRLSAWRPIYTMGDRLEKELKESAEP